MIHLPRDINQLLIHPPPDEEKVFLMVNDIKMYQPKLGYALSYPLLVLEVDSYEMRAVSSVSPFFYRNRAIRASPEPEEKKKKRKVAASPDVAVDSDDVCKCFW